MMEALQQFHFLRPWWLLALVLLPLWWWLGVRRSGAQVQLSRLVDAELLPLLLRGRAASGHQSVWLFTLGWMLASLALAGPTWSRVAQPLYASRGAQVVALSLSQHMLARDVAPSRLARARLKTHALLDSNRDGLNALVAYAGEAFVVAPLTTDAHSLSDLLDSLTPDTMPLDGNDAALAIKRGVTLIHDAKVSSGSLVLITDQADAAAVAAARNAKAAGVRVSVLGVGTPGGGPVPEPGGGFLHDARGNIALVGRDDAALSAVARAGGGVYVPMQLGHGDIDALHAQLRAGSTSKVKGQVGDEWQDQGPWLLLPLLLIVALGFRRGWLLLLPLVLLPLWPAPALAGTWTNLWQRPDQQAAQALRAGDAAQAQKLARDPAWRGAADYRAGDYAAAEQALQKSSGTDAAYNLGNALARQGKYEEAIKAYDRALKLAPTNADATANRKAVEDWLKQQKKKSPPESSQDKKAGESKKQPGQQGDQGKSPSDSAGGKDKSPPSDDAKSQASSKPGQGNNPSKPDQNKPDQNKPEPSGPDQNNQGQSGQKNSDSAQPNPAQASSAQPPPTAQQAAAQKQRTEQAQKALQQQMDQALGEPSSKAADKTAQPHQLGAMPQDGLPKTMPADLRHTLQGVVDDPGALLRRKFKREYQLRHGSAPNDEVQP
ncbi:MAG: tetratricopeptide repeat protein [Rhodanobacter sp.]